MWKCTKYMLPIFWTIIYLISAKVVNEESTRGIDIDVFFDKYINEIKRTLKLGNQDHNIKKRSYNEFAFNELQGLDILVGFEEVFSLPVTFPNDLVLLPQYAAQGKKRSWYAAALEANKEHPQTSKGNDLVLLKYEDNVWSVKQKMQVNKGVKLATDLIGNTAYIIVAEYHTEKNNGSRVFHVNTDTDTLQYVHTVKTQFPSDVIMWKWEDMDAFAAVAISENAPSSALKYSTQSPVYRWLGSHFDIICTLPTYNPQSLTQFNIRSSMFIAVANFQNDYGETTVDSDIFRYNVDTGIFHLYQKLPTESAVDIKHFCFQNKYIKEHFLVYASAFHTDGEGNKDYNSLSIVYKLSDEEYFVPFQALRVAKITSWTPVCYSNDKQDTLILLAVSEEGLTSFQYDGWKFVPTGVLYDNTVFGPGPKSVNVFYNEQLSLISIANKLSPGLNSVLSPVLKRDPQVENLQSDFLSWEKTIDEESHSLELMMARLQQIAKSAPTVNDPDVNIDAYMIFKHVEINNLKTFSTKIGDGDNNEAAIKQLDSDNNKLNNLLNILEYLKGRIDELSHNSLTVYGDVEIEHAEIFCTSNCKAENLNVNLINGENMTEYLESAINIEEPVEFDSNTEFYDLALTGPLKTKNMNGHSVANIIKWSSNVDLEKGLKVKGDIILNNDTSVRGTIDKVAVNHNFYQKYFIKSPSHNLESLNASQLLLSDGILSQLNFERFTNNTLKIHGDQVITEFQNVERLEADEVLANGGLFNTSTIKSGLPIFCDGKYCSEDDDQVLSESNPIEIIEAASSNQEEIIINRDFTTNGTIFILHGSLAAVNLIDLKNDITAQKVLDFSIPLNKSVINKHFDFYDEFEAGRISVDKINGVNWSSLVEHDSAESVIISSLKEFENDLYVEDDVNICGIENDANVLSKLITKVESIQVDNISTYSIDGKNFQFNGEEFEKLVTLDEDKKVFIDNLHVQENMTADVVMLRGNINQFHLERLLEDSVYNDGSSYLITGKKEFANKLKMCNLTIKSMNNIEISKLANEETSRKLISDAKALKVEKLFYKDVLNGIESEEFGQWLMSEGDQTVLGSQTIVSFEADYVEVEDKAILNSVNFHKLITEAVFITQNVTLDTIIFNKPVRVPQLAVEGKINGLQVPGDIVLSFSDYQEVRSPKIFLGNVIIEGNLNPTRTLSDVDIAAYCKLLKLNNTNLSITGSATFVEEPIIYSTINKVKWVDLMENIWFKEENTHITSPFAIENIEFHNLDVITVNDTNIEELLSSLVSKSTDQVVRGTFYFKQVSILNDLEAREAVVSGHVQGLKLQPFVDNIMLDGVDQDISGLIDFDSLNIEGVLESEGYVNNLNLSEEVMLLNVPNNNITSSLKVSSLITKKMKVPPEILVGGVKIEEWNKTAVKNSISNVITGEITFLGEFDSSYGVRVDGLLNGLSCEHDSLMMIKKPQNITGQKTFSPVSKINIHKLDIEKYLNTLNITHFYDKQITASNKEIISGFKNFTSIIQAKKAFLPELFQGYNLSKIETLLSSPLPWNEYYSQLENITSMRQIADKSLSGQRNLLKNFTRVINITEEVLFVFPLTSRLSTSIATIREKRNKTILSLLEWNSRKQLFLEISGSARTVLKMAPTTLQPVLLPSGDVANYITCLSSISPSAGHGEILQLKGKRVVGKTIKKGYPGSFLLLFEDYKSRLCYVLKENMCQVYCYTDSGNLDHLRQFPCQNVSQVTLSTTKQAVYLFGFKTGMTGELLVWKLEEEVFRLILSVPQFNPVSITSISRRGLYIGVATKHIVGSPQPETITIYRFNEETLEIIEEQSIMSVSPKKVLFATLPSDESVLYVLSDNPASPLEIFLYRGIEGYKRFMVEATLPIPKDIQVFTDHNKRHFVIVNTEVNKYVYQALFQ